MNKRFKPLTVAAATPLTTTKVDVDWKKCFLCQKEDKVDLVIPGEPCGTRTACDLFKRTS